MATSQNAYNNVVEFIDEQIESLYDEENAMIGDEEMAPNGVRVKWTYFQDFSSSEQEIMETDFTTLYDDLYDMTQERVQNLVSELTVQHEDQPTLEDTGNESTSVNPTVVSGEKEKDKEDVEEQISVIVCMDPNDPEITSTPKSKCDALLKDIKDLRISVLTDIGDMLDTKFTMYRRSLATNRAKNHAKLTDARTALMEFKKKFESESAASMADRDRQLYKTLENEYHNTIHKLEEDVSQYVASVNLKTQRNLALNEALIESEAANKQLTGKCERIFEDLTNSYKRCEFVEKNERITKRKLFELQKKFTALQKAATKQARNANRGKLSRSNTRSSSQILELTLAETGPPVDDAAIDEYFEAQQQQNGPCTNCPILQEQLDSYKMKLKSQKSTDSFDRFISDSRTHTFDRSDSVLSDVSSHHAGSEGGIESPHGSPKLFRLDSQQEDDQPGGHMSVTGMEEREVAQQLGADDVGDSELLPEPIITTETPNVPSFDEEYGHKSVLDVVPQEIIPQINVEDEDMSAVTEAEKGMTDDIEGGDNEEEVEVVRHHSQGGGEEAYEMKEGLEDEEGGITFINDSQDVTAEVLDSHILDKHSYDQEEEDASKRIEKISSQDVYVKDSHSRDHVDACEEVKDESEGDDLSVELELPRSISVTPGPKVAKRKLEQESGDDTSVHSSQTSIVANINAIMIPIEKQESTELHLDLTVAEEEVAKDVDLNERKTKRETVMKHHKHHSKHHHHDGKPHHAPPHSHHRPKHAAMDKATQVSHPMTDLQEDDVTVSSQGSLSHSVPDETDMSLRMSSILHSPSSVQEKKEVFSFQNVNNNSNNNNNTDRNGDISALKLLLSETKDSQRSLEKEVSELNKAKQDQDKYIKELSGYIRTQDHIYNLKLKEREILLRELTQQTNDLRGQVVRDKKMFDEMKELADCNLPKIGIQKLKAKKLASKKRKEEMHFFKLDLNSNDLDVARRPATSGGLQAFNAGLHRPSSHQQLSTRPDSSPALHMNLASSMHEFCHAASPSRPSQFSSTGINSTKIEHSWKEEPVTDIKPSGLHGTDNNNNTGVRNEVEEVRKKVALLMSHQDISMKRLRAKPGVSIM